VRIQPTNFKMTHGPSIQSRIFTNLTLQLFAKKALLRGTSQLLFAIAGLLFFFGGRAISAFTKADRLMGEMMGIGLAVVLVIFGMAAKNAADNFDDEDSLR